MQVCAAVRMALYHTGQLERTKAGMQASCISRAWHDFHNDLAALCRELHQWQQHVLYAPKFLHQVSQCREVWTLQEVVGKALPLQLYLLPGCV